MAATDMQSEESPEFYRRRYFELKERAQRSSAHGAHTENPRVLAAGLVIAEETIPGGWYWSTRLATGHGLRIVNDHGTACVSALFWNADDTSERYNPADSVKVQWTTRLTRGKLLLSDMGRVLASITDDTCGMHDSIAGGSTPESNARKYAGGQKRNTRDNFLLAAGKHGLSSRDIGPCINFFAPLETDALGRFVWRDAALKSGDYVDLRAEMNLIVALSNCPHPLSPSPQFEPRPVRAILWRSPAAEANDLCRTATEEAARAFENNAALAQR